MRAGGGEAAWGLVPFYTCGQGCGRSRAGSSRRRRRCAALVRADGSRVEAPSWAALAARGGAAGNDAALDELTALSRPENCASLL